MKPPKIVYSASKLASALPTLAGIKKAVAETCRFVAMGMRRRPSKKMAEILANSPLEAKNDPRGREKEMAEGFLGTLKAMHLVTLTPACDFRFQNFQPVTISIAGEIERLEAFQNFFHKFHGRAELATESMGVGILTLSSVVNEDGTISPQPQLYFAA